MKKSRIIKTMTMVMCVAALSAMLAGVAFADDGVSAQDILDKQQQVDKYLFEENADEIAALGFMITHTAPMETYVEIGITPYTEENANYLYGVFGSDTVKVVEGEQPIPYGDEIYANGLAEEEQPIPYGDEIYANGLAEDNVQAETMPVWVFVIIGAAVAAGVTGFVLVRRKAAR